MKSAGFFPVDRVFQRVGKVVRLGLASILLAAPVAVLCLATGAAITGVVAAADDAPAWKVIQGKVLDDGGKPLPGAIVYLKSSKSDAIKSFISTDAGEYHFGQLSPDTDYTVWAEQKGKKSPTKTIAAFDSKKQFNIDLRLK